MALYYSVCLVGGSLGLVRSYMYRNTEYRDFWRMNVFMSLSIWIWSFGSVVWIVLALLKYTDIDISGGPSILSIQRDIPPPYPSSPDLFYAWLPIFEAVGIYFMYRALTTTPTQEMGFFADLLS